MISKNVAPNTVNKTAQRGNAVIVVLVVLLVIAVGAIAYLSTKMDSGSGESASASSSVAAATNSASEGDQQTAQQGDTPQPVIEPGNPVVAKVSGQDVTRLDVFNFIQTLPPQTRQLPVTQLFPLALDQVVNASVISKQVSGVNLDNDPAVKEQLQAAKSQIVRGVFVQKEVEKAITAERIKQAYDGYVAGFPKIPELKTRHILVEDEATAKDLIKQLKEGADFAALAKEHSTDATKDNGGDLGYISKQDQVIPEFLETAFALEPGSMTEKPLKTEFGYHIIEVTEARDRPPATLEQATPFISAQLRGVVLNELLSQWRDKADVEVFDINGKPIEPAAGDETPEEEAAAPAEAEAAPEKAPAENSAE